MGLESDITLFGRPLSSNGLVGGTLNMRGNYSATPTDFYVEAQAGETLLLGRFLLQIIDAGTFNADKYGVDLILTNGLKFYTKKAGGSRISITGGQTILTNSQLGLYCFDVHLAEYGIGNGDQSISARWSFNKYGKFKRGKPKSTEDYDGLVLKEGDQFGVHLEDDFSGLVGHYCQVQGDHLGIPSSAWQIVI